MIDVSLAKTQENVAESVLIPTEYHIDTSQPLSPSQLSAVGRNVFHELCPKRAKDSIPMLTALRLLDFFSSKQGYIRRKGRSFRTESFYRTCGPFFAKIIAGGRPLQLSGLGFCAPLANTKLAGPSPYPNLGAYIAFENLHKIARAAQQLYTPGVQFKLGFEARLFQSVYFQPDTVLDFILSIYEDLNEIAHRNVNGRDAVNPVQMVDSTLMVAQAFGSFEHFNALIEKRKPHINPAITMGWQEWYRKTATPYYFPSMQARDKFIEDRALWRYALFTLKYEGGKYGKGFLGFTEDAYPFTPGGRRTDKLALQMIPESSYLPHQRLIVYDSSRSRWRLEAYEDIQTNSTIYVPHFVQRYSYPFYFEKNNSLGTSY